jgi:hypothetical protein
MRALPAAANAPPELSKQNLKSTNSTENEMGAKARRALDPFELPPSVFLKLAFSLSSSSRFLAHSTAE